MCLFFRFSSQAELSKHHPAHTLEQYASSATPEPLLRIPRRSRVSAAIDLHGIEIVIFFLSATSFFFLVFRLSDLVINDFLHLGFSFAFELRV